VRRGFLALVALVAALAMTAQTALTPDQLLQRGKQFYREAKYPDAIDDLRAASTAALSPEERQKYVTSGQIDTIPTLEESLVYLALAYAKIGRDNEARDAVTRLLNAERIKPTYATLALDPETAEFEPLAARLAPSMPLPHNDRTQTASAAPAPSMRVQPTLAQQREEMLRTVDERVAAARAEIEAAANAKIADAQRAADARVAQERAAAQQAADARVSQETAAAQRTADERVAAERAAAQKKAEELIAAETAAIQRSADERIAQERAEADKAAAEKIAAERAAIEQNAEQRIAAERAAAQKAADEKMAVERATLQQQTEVRVAAERDAAEKAATARITASEAEQRRKLLLALREAETYALAGQLGDANRVYNAIAQNPNATREAIAAAATGLYRTSDFPDAVIAFQHLGAFARGEEDLRYYNAVSLYETGRYDQAKKEMICALPYLQQTEDVLRYKAKIEQSATQQAAK
jgi:hypothetical protein